MRPVDPNGASVIPTTVSLDGLRALAEEVHTQLRHGGVVWLVGEMGAGKTTFVRHFAEQVGAAQGAHSPTYALVHEYATPGGPLIHVDCFRLRAAEEAEDLDLFGLTKRATWLFVEWPEGVERFLPEADVVVRLAHTNDPDLRLATVDR